MKFLAAALLALALGTPASASPEAASASVRRTTGPRPPRDGGAGWVQCASLDIKNTRGAAGAVTGWLEIAGGRIVDEGGDSGPLALREAGSRDTARRYSLEATAPLASQHVMGESGLHMLAAGAEVGVPFCVRYASTWSAEWAVAVDAPAAPGSSLQAVSLARRQQPGMFYADWQTGQCRCRAAGVAPVPAGDQSNLNAARTTTGAAATTTKAPAPPPPPTTTVTQTATTTATTTETTTQTTSQTTQTNTQSRTASRSATRSPTQTAAQSTTKRTTSLSTTLRKSTTRTTSSTTVAGELPPSTTTTFAPTNDASPYNAITVDVDARGEEPVEVSVFMPGTYRIEVVPSGTQGLSWEPASAFDGFALRRTAITCASASGCTADGTTNGYSLGWEMRSASGRINTVKRNGVTLAAGDYTSGGQQRIVGSNELVYPAAGVPAGLPSFELYTNCWNGDTYYFSVRDTTIAKSAFASTHRVGEGVSLRITFLAIDYDNATSDC
ncbi:hypothetical protein DFJ74DRAFT_689502 [Hyaloraphidium curvatum]|nr:hypothetical protein DFJ74DRAFT_689502 [Hyaloraphidium curvatum]